MAARLAGNAYKRREHVLQAVDFLLAKCVRSSREIFAVHVFTDDGTRMTPAGRFELGLLHSASSLLQHLGELVSDLMQWILDLHEPSMPCWSPLHMHAPLDLS